MTTERIAAWVAHQLSAPKEQQESEVGFYEAVHLVAELLDATPTPPPSEPPVHRGEVRNAVTSLSLALDVNGPNAKWERCAPLIRSVVARLEKALRGESRPTSEPPVVTEELARPLSEWARAEPPYPRPIDSHDTCRKIGYKDAQEEVRGIVAASFAASGGGPSERLRELVRQLSKQLGEGALELGKHKEAVRDLRLALGGAIQVIAAMKVEHHSLSTYDDETVAEVLRKAGAANISTYFFDLRNLGEKITRDAALQPPDPTEDDQ